MIPGPTRRGPRSSCGTSTEHALRQGTPHRKAPETGDAPQREACTPQKSGPLAAMRERGGRDSPQPKTTCADSAQPASLRSARPLWASCHHWFPVCPPRSQAPRGVPPPPGQPRSHRGGGHPSKVTAGLDCPLSKGVPPLPPPMYPSLPSLKPIVICSSPWSLLRSSWWRAHF